MSNGFTKAQLLADLATIYKVVADPVQQGDETFGVRKYIVNILEVGKSEANIKPTGFRRNITFYVYHEGLGDESAYYERVEPDNISNTNVVAIPATFLSISALYDSITLQKRVRTAVQTQCSIVFQESTTSVTSLTIGTGSKSLTCGTGKSYSVGQQMSISNNGTNYMTGNVTSYNPTTGALVVNVTAIGGSGTFSSWTVVPTNHTNRMKLVYQSTLDLQNVVMRFMSAIALNSTVQTNGTAVDDATLMSIVSGAWDSYATLIVT
jgi:hypothetical protein